MGTNTEVLREGYAAFARQDIPAVLGMFDPGIDWTTPDSVPIGGHFVGHDGVVGFFMSLGENYSALEVTPSEFIEQGDRVVALGALKGTGAKSGTSFDIPFSHVWTFKNGRATAFFEYYDTARMNEALGG